MIVWNEWAVMKAVSSEAGVIIDYTPNLNKRFHYPGTGKEHYQTP